LLEHMQVCGRMGGAHVLQAARATTPSGENYTFALEVPHVPTPFEQRMQRLSMAKITLSHWKRDCIILLLVWHVLMVVRRFVAYEVFFLFFFSFLPLKL